MDLVEEELSSQECHVERTHQRLLASELEHVEALVEDLAQLGHARGRSAQLATGLMGRAGEQARDRRLAGAGRTPQDQRAERILLDEAAQQRALAEKVLLAAARSARSMRADERHVIERGGTDAIGQRLRSLERGRDRRRHLRALARPCSRQRRRTLRRRLAGRRGLWRGGCLRRGLRRARRRLERAAIEIEVRVQHRFGHAEAASWARNAHNGSATAEQCARRTERSAAVRRPRRVRVNTIETHAALSLRLSRSQASDCKRKSSVSRILRVWRRRVLFSRLSAFDPSRSVPKGCAELQTRRSPLRSSSTSSSPSHPLDTQRCPRWCGHALRASPEPRGRTGVPAETCSRDNSLITRSKRVRLVAAKLLFPLERAIASHAPAAHDRAREAEICSLRMPPSLRVSRPPRSPDRRSPHGSPTASCFSPRGVVRSPRILRSRGPSPSAGTATPPVVGGGWSGSTLGSLSKRALDRVDRRRRHAPSSPDLTSFGPEVPPKLDEPVLSEVRWTVRRPQLTVAEARASNDRAQARAQRL